MRFASVDYEKRGRIAIITLDEQTKLNSLSPSIREGLIQSYNEVENDPEIRAAILTGAGRAFCAGMDLTDVKIDSIYMWRMMKELLSKVLNRAEQLSKPVIGAINGMALGGGIELAISCDILIASDKAQFGAPETKLGALPPMGLVRLPEMIGRAWAKEMIMIGDPISADDALRIGLVNRVVPHEKLLEESIAFAEKLAQRPRDAIMLAKSAINRTIGGEEMVYCSDATPLIFSSEDIQEGISAFLEKRPPSFK